MVKFETVNGSRKVISTANDEQGVWTSCLYVNNGEDITGIRGKHMTRKGAEKWAKKELSK